MVKTIYVFYDPIFIYDLTIDDLLFIYDWIIGLFRIRSNAKLKKY